jgi:hypothetical protein
MVLPSGQVVTLALPHETVQSPPSQSTLHEPVAAQSILQEPVHSIAQPFALLQSTLEPAPTTARHVSFSELQSRWQFAPQFAPQEAALLQSTWQFAPQEL